MKSGLFKINRGKEIFLKGDPLELLTPIGSFYITLDVDNKMIQVQVPDGFKLGFVNGLDIAINGDFDVDTIGEVNLTSRNADINIDSLEAFIHLNSLKTKPIRDDSSFDEHRNALMDESAKHKDKIERQKKCGCEYSELLELVADLSSRVAKLEQQDSKVIDIKKT